MSVNTTKASTRQYTLNTQMHCFMFPSSSNIYREHKKHWYLVYCKGLQQPWQYTVTDIFTYCFIFGLFYWWSDRHPSSSGKRQCTVKNKLSPRVLHTVLSLSDKQSSQYEPYFLPSNLPCGCVVVLISSPLRKIIVDGLDDALFMCEAIHQAACP